MRTARALTLTQRLLLTVLVPVSLLSVLISILYLDREAELTEQATRDRGMAMVSFLAPAAEYGVISGNAVNLRSLLAAALAQQDVVAAAIYDRSGELGAVGDSPAIVDLGRVAATVAPRLVGASAGRYAFAAPVTSQPVAVDDLGAATAAAPAPEVIGWVYVELDTRSYAARRRMTALTVLAFAFATMIGTGVLAVRLARSVGEPVGRLVDAVRRMAAGDLDVRVAVGGGQELGELQQGFNNMARSIADATHNLQARVEEATGQLAYQALHDPLTGLPNRRAFEQALEDAVLASRRAADHGALCFIDLDRFKEVNDTCGHAAGDALLQEIGDLIRHRVRAQDLICRVGGDEFALILRGCSPEDARRIAEGLGEAVETHAFEWDGRTFRVGASIGLARIDDHTRSPSDVLKAADIACYEAKRNGRGRVVESGRAVVPKGKPA
ncbi:GGDEF domain-containing protein [Thauera sinica]|uniref:diguanylate cyclase n=1 Tax=Thauera sinica TaxID=2665146 RepID=A0ABW1APN6_9RHOO|nr:GGDEF domain-containing protein [Thauera sp. K11]ATE62225.1 GGDEF domain-containing protein [Thauera sp. K11]